MGNTEFEKIKRLMQLDANPLFEPCHFQLLETRLKRQERKIGHATSPRGVTVFSLDKTSGCTATGGSLPGESRSVYAQLVSTRKGFLNEFFTVKSAPIKLPRTEGFIFKEEK